MKHGHAQRGMTSRTYNTWKAMVARCSRTTAARYHRYGGRGIKVCTRWLVFENFLADMGERPAGKTLDRFPNNDGDYEPGNARWATPKQQSANQCPRKHGYFRTDLNGERFGRLVVVEALRTVAGRSRWLCRCDCGNTTDVRGDVLKGGKAKSCGCLASEASSATMLKYHAQRDPSKVAA